MLETGRTHRVVTHSIVPDRFGRYLASPSAQAAEMMTMPRRQMAPTETPDFSALTALAELCGDETPELTGDYSHAIQLSGAPEMLVKPELVIWHASELHLYYRARLRPSRAHSVSQNDLTWVAGESLWEPELGAVGLAPHQARENRPEQTRTLFRTNCSPHRAPERLRNAPKPRELSVAVFVNHGRKTLLHYHAKAQMWLPPGGHIEAGESPDDAAIREVLEETGLTVELISTGCDYPRTGAKAKGAAASRILACPEGVQIEVVQGGHEHLDFVYFSHHVNREMRPTQAEPDPMLGFRWYNREDAQSLNLTPEMQLWCDKIWSVAERSEL